MAVSPPCWYSSIQFKRYLSLIYQDDHEKSGLFHSWYEENIDIWGSWAKDLSVSWRTCLYQSTVIIPTGKIDKAREKITKSRENKGFSEAASRWLLDYAGKIIRKT